MLLLLLLALLAAGDTESTTATPSRPRSSRPLVLFTVKEGSPIGTLIGDLDRDGNNESSSSTNRYRLINSDANARRLFQVGQDGRLTTSGPIDREQVCDFGSGDGGSGSGGSGSSRGSSNCSFLLDVVALRSGGGFELIRVRIVLQDDELNEVSQQEGSPDCQIVFKKL